ncbi:MAG: hypothetical protein K0R00_4145 [Herbinix sp.]|nr:hypothetical protein [Herbinix sp.]
MGGTIPAKQGEVIIDLMGIRRSYKNGGQEVKALKEVDLQIKQGEFIGIIGPSASGKSTLLNLLGCLDTPTTGVYRLHGKQVNSLSTKDKALIRNKIFGFVFQSFHLLPDLNVNANVALPLKYGKTPKRQRATLVKNALSMVGLSDIGEKYPDQLSGGQLADEPTGCLDIATGQSIMEELLSLRNELNRTVIVITHDPRIAGYADRLIRIEDGVIKEDTLLSQSNISVSESKIKNPFEVLEQED